MVHQTSNVRYMFNKQEVNGLGAVTLNVSWGECKLAEEVG